MIHGTEYGGAGGSRPRRRRRVMRSFRISEISAVDRPAQAGARAVIMKRAGGGAPTGARSVNEPYAIMRRCEDEIDRLADVCKRGGETREQATSRLVVEGYPLMKSLARTRDLAYEAAVARMGPPPGSGPVGAALKRGAPDAGMARVGASWTGWRSAAPTAPARASRTPTARCWTRRRAGASTPSTRTRWTPPRGAPDDLPPGAGPTARPLTPPCRAWPGRPWGRSGPPS